MSLKKVPTAIIVSMYSVLTDLRATHELHDPAATDALAGLGQPPLAPDGPRGRRRAVHEVGRERLRAVHGATAGKVQRINQVFLTIS